MLIPSAVRTPGILLLPVWPLPRSLATTSGISVDFFSSPYLDVSVQAVPHIHLFDSVYVDSVFHAFASPWLIVDRYVLRRLLVPRHSPYALSSLTMFFSRDSSVLRLRSRRRSTDFSRKVLILCSNHLVLVWVFSLDDNIL